jgi:hypothetical protein
VFDAWGLDRCFRGTDWTRAFAVVNYEQTVEPIPGLSNSKRAMLMGGSTASRRRKARLVCGIPIEQGCGLAGGSAG